MIASTRVLPQSLDATWDRLAAASAKLAETARPMQRS